MPERLVKLIKCREEDKMTYTPDMLIKAEEFDKAFQKQFDEYQYLDLKSAIYYMRKVVGNIKEIKDLNKLYFKKQNLFSNERLKFDKIKELSEEEKQKIVKERLKNNNPLEPVKEDEVIANF